VGEGGDDDPIEIVDDRIERLRRVGRATGRRFRTSPGSVRAITGSVAARAR